MKPFTTFDEWVDLFKAWQREIGVDNPWVSTYPFEAKFGELKTHEIQFGAFRSHRKWEKVTQTPDQRIRDALLHLIVVQGDTEFASVEQQRHLFETAPTPFDREALARIMCEEMRHGFQMSYLLVEHFGRSGRIEAQKLLERRAFKKNRLLGSFNVEINNWLDFFVYTEFIDRDGKFQLKMLSTSSFAPLARSMGPMLKEESFHLGTGHIGIARTLRGKKVPVQMIQRYMNRWVPTAYDLFGKDHSSTPHWAYVWGLKGRYDEETAGEPADLDRLNEAARDHYLRECQGLVERLNRLIPEDQPKLFLPDVKFNRQIGDFAGTCYSVDGTPLTEEVYARHPREVLPTEEDQRLLDGLFREKDWIALPTE